MNHGFAYEIARDNAPNLTIATVTNHCKEYVINHHKAIPYWPKTNTEIEQFSRALGKTIESILETEIVEEKYMTSYFNTIQHHTVLSTEHQQNY